MRIANYGVSHLPPNQSKKGDHILTFAVDIPKILTQEQRELRELLFKQEKRVS